MHAHFLIDTAEWKNACSITTDVQLVKLNSMFRPNKVFKAWITSKGPMTTNNMASRMKKVSPQAVLFTFNFITMSP
jgi:hypothetical protein